MRRRDLLLLAGGVTAALASAARAQRQYRIGLLRLAPADAKQFANFRKGLQETGFIEGRNLVIESRYADGDYKRLPGLAGDLVRQKVEVIMTSGGADTAKAAMQATATIPIVGTSVGSLVKHFNRPEGNVTGVDIVTGNLAPKRLQILAGMFPGATIGVVMNPAASFYDRDRKAIEEAARTLGVKLAYANVSTDADLGPAFASLVRHVGALMPEAEPFLGNNWQTLVALAAKYRIPMMQEWGKAVAAGGLISYAPSLAWVEEEVGRYTGQILKGVKPADLPVEQPTKFELVINLKTANALGLTVPPLLLAQADEIVE